MEQNLLLWTVCLCFMVNLTNEAPLFFTFCGQMAGSESTSVTTSMGWHWHSGIPLQIVLFETKRNDGNESNEGEREVGTERVGPEGGGKRDWEIWSVCVRERKRQRERDYKFIQKHNRGLNRVPARTYIFACLNQLSYRCQEREKRGMNSALIYIL